MDTTMATTNSRRPRFLSLPPEIRKMIYRLAFFCKSSSDPTSCLPESGQVIRTCKHIYSEALPILYGEYTSEIDISNTWGPRYTKCYYSDSLDAMFDGPHYKPFRQRYREAVLLHLRSFRVEIKYTEMHSLQLIRNEVRDIIDRLLKMSTVRFLELVCELDCDNENFMINWRDACWDNYDRDGSKRECIGMIRTWFGRLRGVQKVVIKGLPDKDAETLRARLQAPAQGAEGPRKLLMALPGMYASLEKHVRGSPIYEEDLEAALLAAESDNVEEFKVRKDAIHEALKKHWEGIKNDQELWGF